MVTVDLSTIQLIKGIRMFIVIGSLLFFSHFSSNAMNHSERILARLCETSDDEQEVTPALSLAQKEKIAYAQQKAFEQKTLSAPSCIAFWGSPDYTIWYELIFGKKPYLSEESIKEYRLLFSPANKQKIDKAPPLNESINQ